MKLHAKASMMRHSSPKPWDTLPLEIRRDIIRHLMNIVSYDTALQATTLQSLVHMSHAFGQTNLPAPLSDFCPHIYRERPKSVQDMRENHYRKVVVVRPTGVEIIPGWDSSKCRVLFPPELQSEWVVKAQTELERQRVSTDIRATM